MINYNLGGSFENSHNDSACNKCCELTRMLETSHKQSVRVLDTNFNYRYESMHMSNFVIGLCINSSYIRWDTGQRIKYRLIR